MHPLTHMFDDGAGASTQSVVGFAGSGSAFLTALIVNAPPSVGHVIAHEVYPVAAV